MRTFLGCSIWRDAQVQQELYRYYKPETRGLDQEGLLEDLAKGSPGDVVLLHACAHNPTGALSSPSSPAQRSSPCSRRANGRCNVFPSTPAAVG